MKNSISHNYGKKYFTEQFNAVGEFNQTDLRRNVNWFISQLKFFENRFGLDFNTAGKILEIGCAIGGIAYIFKAKGVSSYALDISQFAIDRAKKLSSGIKFYICDIQKKIPTREKFDFVFAFEVLEHLENPLAGLINIKKTLNANGKLIATTPYPFKKYLNINTHVNVLAPQKWNQLMKKAGFKKIDFQPVTFLPFFYRINPRLGLILPFNSNLPFINSTIFYVAQ